MQTKKLELLLTTITISLLLSNITLAQPGIPHAFYGYVTLNSAPAPDGTTVTAKINGVEVASTTTKNGKYGYPPGSFLITDPENTRSGEEIRFFVNGVDTGQFFYFCNGCVTELNLAAITTGGQQPSGGGGGGSTTGGTQPNQTSNQTVTQQTCQERWVCSEWSECVNGIQTRSCVDQNNCGTNNNEPFTSQPCSAEERKEEGTSSQGISGITGFFAFLSNPVYTLILALIAIIIVLSLILLKKKK